MNPVSSSSTGFIEKSKADRDFWLEKLAGGTGLSNIIFDYERPQSYSGERRTVETRLGGETPEMLKALSGGSPFLAYVVMHAALKVCLYKYTQSEVVTVGSPSLRDDGASKQMANALPIKDNIDDRLSFKEFLLRVRETLLEAYARQRFPFNRVVKDLGLGFSRNRYPFFDILLALDGFHVSPPELKNDLTITFTVTADDVIGRVDYVNSLFTEERIVRFINHFTSVLREGLRDKAKLLHEFDLLEDDERLQILMGWNATETDYVRDKCFHHLFEAQAEINPRATALIFEDRRMSYGELNERANQLAHHLRRLGVGPDTIVGIGIERSLEMVVGLIGVLKSGGCYLPLDRSYLEQRLAFMLKDACARVILTTKRWPLNLPPGTHEVVCLDADRETIAGESKENPEARVLPDNLAYIIYTSGSSGKPKGVLIPHRGLMNYLSWAGRSYPIAEGGGSVVHSPLAFDLTVTSLLTPLLAGKAVTLLPEGEEIDALSGALAGDKIFSLIKITPAHLDALNAYVDGDRIAGCAKAVIIGGEAVRGEILHFWQAHSPGTRLINEYGPTETVVGCCTYELPGDARLSGAVPIGRPIANTRIYLLDSRLRPVPIGMRGELCVAGDGLARGYLNSPDSTALKFIPDPFSKNPGGRLYRTGDSARYLPDGNMVFLGRSDNQIKIRGYRIELGEIEEALGEHPAVQNCVVVLREDKAGEKRLVAYLVADLAESSIAGTLKSFLQERLPDYAIPGVYQKMEALPLTRNGKVDRAALPLPDELRREPGCPFVAPRTETELALANIWSQVLKTEGLGINDNFFNIGGHSITAVQVTSRIREALDVELALRDIFNCPTIATLSAVIEGAKNNSTAKQSPPLVSVSREFYRRK
jgi:amino acid adenylation domain-containing protein